MLHQTFGCEINCESHDPVTGTDFIVLTGGPGAGKTAVLEYVRKLFCCHVAILPEAAGILFGGGFWRLDSVSARKSVQRAIYHVQEEMQNLVRNEKKWIAGLCDRGTLDGFAYWPNSETTFFQDLKTSREKEYAKYKAIIHLRSPSREHGYNFQNPHRIETAEHAAEIDQRIYEVWHQHPEYHVIDSRTNFIEKIEVATRCIRRYLPDGVWIGQSPVK